METAITSLANPRVKAIAALAQKKERSAAGVFVVEGLPLVELGLAAGWQLETLLVESMARVHSAAAERAAGEVLVVTDAVMGKMCHKDNPQAVAGVFRQQVRRLRDVTLAGPEVWVLLEGLRDPGNVGTIVRTADAAGAAGVMLLGPGADVWSPEAVRATMGSIFHVPVVQATLDDFAAWRQGFTGLLVGTHLHGAEDYRAVPATRPLLLCMGTEQNGLSERLAGLCDVNVKIPMRGRAESLNVAMATGIMLYQLIQN